MKMNEFRADLANQFNKVLAGEDVLIERGGITFRLIVESLIPSFDEPEKNMPRSATPKKGIAVSKEAYVGLADSIEASSFVIKPEALQKAAESRGTCKNGHVLNMRGKCDVKGCKYS